MPAILPPALTDPTNAQTTIEWLLGLAALLGAGLGGAALFIWRSTVGRISRVEKKIAALEQGTVTETECEKNHGRFVAEFRRIAEEDRRDRAEFRAEFRESIAKLSARLDAHIDGHA